MQTVESCVQFVDHAQCGLVVDVTGVAPHVSSPDISTGSIARGMTNRTYRREVTGIKAIDQLMQLSLCLLNLVADHIHWFVALDRLNDRTDRGMKMRRVSQQMLVTGRLGEVITNFSANVPRQRQSIVRLNFYRSAPSFVSEGEICRDQERHRKRCLEECHVHDLSHRRGVGLSLLGADVPNLHG